MKMRSINKTYVNRFIESMENDYKEWKMSHYEGPGVSWTEYHSPDYENENGRVSFGFSFNDTGAWINGHFSWSLPLYVAFNPFSKVFWRFRKAKSDLKLYLQSKELEEYMKILNSVVE